MNSIVSTLFGLIIISPSLKLLINTPIINLAFALILIFLTAVHVKTCRLNRDYTIILLSMIAYTMVIYIANLSTYSLHRIFNWFVYVFAAIIFRKNIDHSILVNIIKYNGLILSVLTLLGVQIISKNYGSYLTLSLPIGMAMIGFLLSGIKAKRYRLIFMNFFFWTICISAVATLLSRSVIIFTVIVTVLMLLDKLKFYKSIIVLFLSVLIVVNNWTLIEQNLAQFERLRMLFVHGDKARLDLSQDSWEFLRSGWGLIGSGGSYIERIGYYPHNVLLESLLIGGIPLFSLFVMLLALLLRKSRESLYYIGCFGFLQWFSSFEFWTTYIFIIPLLFNDSISSRSYITSTK